MNPNELRMRDLRRLVGGLWSDPRCDGIASAVLDAAVAADAKSCDRAVLTAYLRYFPSGHPAFERLRAAAAMTAERRDWRWRIRGQRWRLWDPDAGPAAIAKALLSSHEAPVTVLREAGLDGDLAQGEFVAEAVESACEEAGAARGERAVAMGTRLVALFEQLAVADLDADLADALLSPWLSQLPGKEYLAALSRFLTARIGDPRFEVTQWARIEANLKARGRQKPQALADILRGWLTEATVRAFFKIVRTTTDRKDQWDAREAFWLGYIESGAITAAWFAFGRRAEILAGRLAVEENIRFGRVTGGANPTHSALIMSIGGLRIAEWSHDGALRFWPNPDEPHHDSRFSRMKAPELYQDNYDGNLLRTMIGPKGFDYMSHVSGWQGKAANTIFRHTGRQHPRWGGH